jgi:hypothetical protein
MLRSRTLLALPLALVLSAPAAADPAADATRIAELSVTEEIFAGVFAAQAPLIAGSMAHEFRTLGITVNDMDRFVAILAEEMTGLFTARMREEIAPFYLQSFTPEELAEIRAFYESPTGLVLMEQTPELMLQGAIVGERIGLEIGAEIGPALAARLEAEGVQVTGDRSTMQRLLDALR